VHILGHLSHADINALKLADPRVTRDLRTAVVSWTTRAIMQAKLVTVLQGKKPFVVVVVPLVNGYLVNGTFVSRRTFVHELPRICLAGLGDAPDLCCIESCMCFERGVARTLGFGGTVQEVDGAIAWCGPRMRTNVGALFRRHEWPMLIQRHARFYVNWRVGPPKRQRGRRARRWTKVTPHAGGPS